MFISNPVPASDIWNYITRTLTAIVLTDVTNLPLQTPTKTIGQTLSIPATSQNSVLITNNNAVPVLIRVYYNLINAVSGDYVKLTSGSSTVVDSNIISSTNGISGYFEAMLNSGSNASFSVNNAGGSTATCYYDYMMNKLQ